MASVPLFYDRKLGTAFSNIPALITFADGASYNLILLTAEALLQENFQAQKSFSDDIYLVTFGQQLSPIKLAGYQDVSPTCKTGGANKGSDVVKFYQDRRITASGTPVTVTFNKLTVKGIVISLDVQPIRADGMTGYRYELNLLGQMMVPTKNNRNSNSSANTGASTAGTSSPTAGTSSSTGAQTGQAPATSVDTTNPDNYSSIQASSHPITNDQSNRTPPPYTHTPGRHEE